MAEAGGLLESREVEASLNNIVRPQLKIYLCAYALVYTYICVCMCKTVCTHMCSCICMYVHVCDCLDRLKAIKFLASFLPELSLCLPMSAHILGNCHSF